MSKIDDGMLLSLLHVLKNYVLFYGVCGSGFLSTILLLYLLLPVCRGAYYFANKIQRPLQQFQLQGKFEQKIYNVGVNRRATRFSFKETSLVFRHA